MAQVFISYSRKDLPFVEQLATDLKKAGLDVWYDVSALSGGSRWRVEIENAIRNSQFVIVVLSPDSIDSEWVEREFLFASNLRRKIVPLKYRPCEIPLNYLNLNYIDAQEENYDQNFDELLEALSIDPSVTTLPFSKVKKPSFKLKTEYVIAIIGGGATIIAALLSSPLIEKIFAPIIVPTTSSTSSVSVQTIKVTAPVTLVPTETASLAPLPTQIVAHFEEQMVLVSAGNFMMGSEDGRDDERPAHTVYLDAFYINQYEVTNILYEACVGAGVCSPPNATNSSTRSNYYGNSEFDNHPVIFVDWDQAKSYCEWRGARLPTEAEWEKAARGIDQRTYPWGDKIDKTFANYGGNIGDTTQVGSYSTGISPYGAYDMAGNVWEWVADWYSETYYQISPASNPLGPDSGEYRVLRGGAWDIDENYLLVYSHYRNPPDDFNRYVGFRCARDANP